MEAMFAVILVCCAVTGLQAHADLQSIQDARPLSVDLSSQSNTALANSAGTEIDEGNLGGYRPLYPPYFPREPSPQSNSAQPKSVYYDREYYTRGVYPGITDDRLDRQLKTATGANPFLPSTRPVFPSTKRVITAARPGQVGPGQPTFVGAQPAITDEQNNLRVKIAAGTNPFLPSTRPVFPEARPVAPPTLTGVQPGFTDDRSNRQIEITKSHFSHSASSSFSSSYSFHSVQFPSS